MAKIQITISAENAQAIAALKQVAGVAGQTGNEIEKAGEESGMGFSESFKEIIAYSKQAVTAIKDIAEAATQTATSIRSTGAMVQEGFAAIVSEGQQAVAAIKDIATAAGQAAGSVSQAGQTGAAGLEAIDQAAAEAKSDIQDVGDAANKVGTAVDNAGQKGADGLDAAAGAAAEVEKKTKAAGDEGTKAGEKIKAGGEKGRDGLKESADSAETLSQKLANITITAGGIAMALEKVKDFLKSLIQPGMDFNSTMETAQLAIAGMLISMTTVNGQAWKLPDAMKEADKYLGNVVKQARQWRLAVDDVLETYQGVFAQGLRGGMMPDQIAEFSAVMTKAAYAFNLPKNQILQEARSILSGDIDQNSQIARALGITNADIERAKQSAEGLFAYLMRKLSGFKGVAEKYSETLPGKIKQLKDAFTQASSEGFKSFDDFGKKVLDEIASKILVIDKNTKEIKGVNPELLRTLQSVSDALVSIIQSILSIGEQISPVVVSALRGIADILELIAKNGSTVFEVISSFFIAQGLSSVFGGVAGSIRTVFTVLGTVMGAISELTKMVKFLFVTTLADGLVSAIKGFKDFITIIKEGNKALKVMQLLSALKNPILFAATLAAVANIDTIIEKTESFFNVGKGQGQKSDWNPEGKPQRPNRDEEDAVIKRQEEEAAKELALKENREAWDLIKSRYDVRVQAIQSQADAEIKDIQDQIKELENKQEAATKLGEPGDINYEKRLSGLNQAILATQLWAKQQARSELVDLIAVGNNQEKQSEINPFKAQLNKLDEEIRSLSGDISQSATEFSQVSKIVQLVRGSMQGLAAASGQAAGDIQSFMTAVSGQESGSDSGDYTVANERTGAYGRFQIMPDNWRPWVTEAIQAGIEVGYEKNAVNQDKVAQWKMEQYFKQFGNWRDVAVAWYAGPNAVVNRSKYDYDRKQGNGDEPSINEYADSVMARMGKSGGGSGLDMSQLDQSTESLKKALTAVEVTTPRAKSLIDEANSLINEAQKIDQELLTQNNKVLEATKKQLEPQKDALVKMFKAWGWDEYADKAEKVYQGNIAQASLEQAQKDFELANGQLVENQKVLLNELASGSKSADAVTAEYVTQYHAQTDQIVVNLKKIIADADKSGKIGLSNSARALLRQIIQSVNDFADAVIQRLDADLQNEISMINANHKLTSRQKQDLIDEATRKTYADKAAREEEKAQKLRDTDRKAGNNDNAATIISFEESAALYRELSKLPTLLEKVHDSAKQAFEDGLLDFLERGILECKNLGEAVRNLALSVLQSIQKVYAEALTKNLMSLWFPASGGGSKPQSSSGYTFTLPPLPTKVNQYAEGGSMDSGKVTGPGTETSDSILAWAGNIKKFIRIANGEFVMRGAAVRKYGTAFLERLNSGIVPTGMLQRYAVGGSLTDRSPSERVIGPQELTANLSNSTTIPLNIMNIVDQGMMGKFMQTKEGKRTLLNYIKDNAGTIQRVLNIPR